MEKILVTGGAGYIGSFTVDALLKAGYEVVIVDNLSKGHVQAVPYGASLAQFDLRSWWDLRDLMMRYSFDGVVHLAALASVEESMRKPWLYMSDNVEMARYLIDLSIQSGVRKFIFASTANVYGHTDKSPWYSYNTVGFSEYNTPAPSSPYGEGKLMVEQMLMWAHKLYNLQTVSLRFFNAAGADPNGVRGEQHTPETHLIPNLIRAARLGEAFHIYGSDYPTSDGTAVRDYVHVIDIARGIRLALETEKAEGVLNLGSGKGVSIDALVHRVNKLTERSFPLRYEPRRQGDPDVLIASIQLAATVLGWEPLFTMDDILSSTLKWQTSHPEGYGPA